MTASAAINDAATTAEPLNCSSLYLTLERPLNACPGRIAKAATTELVGVAQLIDRSGGRFADLLDAPVAAEAISALRAAETINRPAGLSRPPRRRDRPRSPLQAPRVKAERGAIIGVE
jgi:hypothetical protein